MGRLTLRLPQTLHERLCELADQEGVSLNQYIVYALTRQMTLDYTAQAVPERAIAEQRASYAALLDRLGKATFDEIQAVMDEREPAEPETGLDAEAMQRLRERMER